MSTAAAVDHDRGRRTKMSQTTCPVPSPGEERGSEMSTAATVLMSLHSAANWIAQHPVARLAALAACTLVAGKSLRGAK